MIYLLKKGLFGLISTLDGTIQYLFTFVKFILLNKGEYRMDRYHLILNLILHVELFDKSNFFTLLGIFISQINNSAVIVIQRQ